ncbi:hypothetical protein GF377_07995 [candidate division GN15 bacterium]|nr:hypothetical protein [candidate division GN15 bacterium]
MKTHWRIILIASLVLNLAIIYVGYKALEYREHINEFRDLYYDVVEEFSQRAVYADANQALQSDTTVPGRAVFFGTQVIEKWNLETAFPDIEPVNRGIDGQRVAGFLLRFRPDVIELRPEAVVIEVSSYNLRSNTRITEAQDFVASLAELALYHNIEPILTTMIAPVEGFEVFEDPGYVVKDSVAVYNRWLRAFAADGGYILADWHSALSDSAGYLAAEYAASRVDPNQLGYRRMADEIKRALEAAGLQPTGP